MELTQQRKYLSVKLRHLEGERDHLLSAVNHHVNNILQQGRSWIDGTNEDGDSNSQTYKEISQLVEDTAILIAQKYGDLTDCDDHDDPVTETSTATATAHSSDVNVGAFQTSAESEELKSVVARIEMMEKEYSSLKDHVYGEMNKKLEDVSQKVVKQEKTAKKISKVEQKLQAVEEIETQNAEKLEAVKQRLKNLEKERENGGNFENIEKRLDSLEEGETENVEKIEELEQRLESLEETETQSAEKLVSVEYKVGDLEKNESQTLEEVATVKAKVSQIETATTSLSNKVENREESVQTLTTTVEAHSSTLESLTSNREIDDAKLRRVQNKVRILEKEKNKSLAKVGKQFEDVEFQYKMVCQIVADRLVPLERLRSILNDKAKSSDENVQKLYTVVQDVADLVPKVSQLENQIFNPTAGVVAMSAELSDIKPRKGRKLYRWTSIVCNSDNRFDSSSGVFFAPVDGIYWVGVSTWQKCEGEMQINVYRCLSYDSPNVDKDELVTGNYTLKNDSSDSDFVVTNIMAGDKLYVGASTVKQNPELSLCRFSVFLVR